MSDAVTTTPLPSEPKPALSVVPRAPARAHPYAMARMKWLPDFIARPLFGKPLAPTAEEWARVEHALMQGDAPMDKVIDWMFANGPRQSKALFDQALTQGITTLPHPPVELQEFFALIDQPPVWLDRQWLVEGARYSRLTGKVGFFVLRDMALMGGYALFNSMNQTLASSGALRKETSIRLGETGKWTNDVTEPHGMERFGPGFITTVRVRMVHALVRRNLRLKADWDTSQWGLPINQIDMLSTYLAFGPVSLLGARLFGVPLFKKESTPIMHLWRYIGWLMGVDEHWLAVTEGDGLRKLYHTFLTHRLPDEKIGHLGQALQDEPLHRHVPELANYPRLAKLKRWFIYQQHISNSALILGPVQRQQLGIPMFALPWYPLLSAPLRFGVLSYFKWRGGETLENYLQKSRERQTGLLQAYFGSREQDIIKPKPDHPAHIA